MSGTERLQKRDSQTKLREEDDNASPRIPRLSSDQMAKLAAIDDEQHASEGRTEGCQGHYFARHAFSARS